MSDDDMYEDVVDSEEEDSEEEEEEDDSLLDEDPLADCTNSYKPTRMTRSNSFEVIDKEELSSQSNKLISDVMDVLGISHPAASTLLRHMKWNKEKLIEKYMDNSEKFCMEAGIPQLALEKPPSQQKLPIYLDLKVSSGPECTGASCPAPRCKAKVHEEAYKALVEPEVFQRYSNFIIKSFVDDNPLVKWCPAPGCGYTIKCERKDRKEAVACKCGFEFCFNCCDSDIGDHMPCPCAQVEEWVQKASDESENVTWMLANTKKCPECRAPIEKNGGCMHMSCKKNSGGCGFEFCWLCRGPWSEHGSATGGYYNCNKYDKSTAKDDDVKAGDAKTELETYMFYYHRYESHRNAMKIADQQRKEADLKESSILHKFEVRSADTKFLLEATEQLLNNRRVLQYSYVYGFYLDKRSQERNLFEYLQEDLEKHTNELSALYETSIDKLMNVQDFAHWKEQVTNYTRITKRFLEKFVEGVSGGLLAQ